MMEFEVISGVFHVHLLLFNSYFLICNFCFFFSFSVVDVIRNTDPSARGVFSSGPVSQGAEAILQQAQLYNTQSNKGNSTSMNSSGNSSPKVKITEQPASKALRFRYECEGRSAGSIPGVNSTPENKTFPSIQVCNYRGRAVVVVSCVTTEKPHRYVLRLK